MASLDQTTLRFELLRVRASIERAELRAAVLELKTTTQPLFSLLAAARRLTGQIEGRRGGIAALAGSAFVLLRERPWLLSTLAAIAARRGLRRWLVLGVVAALGAWFAHAISGRPKG